ncbi:PWWP domain-containing protein 2A isoform X3 [Microcaecilia unicolor]|uniref:PWWP domain-containing protein 2A isoform X3 n=1 Tax=Microcaecilia unicolor TaxID=1415580 RepID=A0A6P7YQW3_9AMPH|nr:PWWP domain-containing protein 2A isoform X3 [Microcaecilia unicolor]
MAAVAAEAAATTASGDGGEAEPEPEPIPGREAGAIHLVPCSAPAVASSEPLVAKAEELPPQRQQQLRAAPVGTRAPELSRSGERESPQADVPEAAERSESERPDPARGSGAGEREAAAREGVSAQGLGKCGQRARTSSASKDEEPLQPPEPRSPAVDSEADPAPEPCRVCEPPELACAPEPEPSSTGRGQEPDASIGSTFPRGADPLCSHAPEPLRMEEPSAAAEPPVPDLPPQESAAEVQPPQAGTVAELIPGSAVWVTLDHIIEDALVVSFQLGERIFSGVLMDLSKRFGPHGIPVTIFPKREYKDKPEAIQLQSKSFQEDTAAKCEEGTVLGDIPPVQVSESSLAQNQWTSKPPPLFHEGAPYPPPLFIRDTYNQSIPQPPPRKIKRPKRKIYREEPPSIMNAIKLRPRQVLCDKCKNSIVADKKEIKRGSSDFSKHEESRKRRHDNVATVNKKLKTDHRVDGKSQNESHKRNVVAKVPTLSHSRGRVVRVSAPANTSKAQLHTKKVLQSKNMDHIKAREVLKMAKEKAQRKQRETSSCKSAHPKVHFTRRCQNTSSGTLPPRLRLKPQRYRNEENDSSLKTGLERVQSSKMAAKPQPRYTSTRSAAQRH